MLSIAHMKQLVQTDIKLIARDNFLLLMFSFLIVIALVLRFALPALDAHFQNIGLMPGPNFAEPLSTYFPLLIGYLIVFQGMLLAGAIYGFLFLDEKEAKTLVAMQVVPIKISHFIGFRLVVPALLSFVAFFGMMFVVGMHLPPWPQAIAIALTAMLTAPITALFYAIFAQNKLQGFGMAKFTAIAGWIILAGWFIPQPYDWLAGIFPPFFATKAYWMVLDGNPNWWISIALGLITQLLMTMAMLGMLRKTLSKLA
jgi:fluoroquinolone transport system permease protein